MKNSRLLTIFIIVFVDLLGFSLILPLMPCFAYPRIISPGRQERLAAGLEGINA